MAIPPFQNIRLAPGEELGQEKQQDVFDAITRNFEDLYANFPNQTELAELKKKVAALEKKAGLSGNISAVGGIVSGSGFTVAHPSTGVYKITLTSKLATAGILVGTPSAGLRTLSATGPSNELFEINIFNTASTALENLAFNFVIKPV